VQALERGEAHLSDESDFEDHGAVGMKRKAEGAQSPRNSHHKARKRHSDPFCYAHGHML
jgi:hypothetical protein